MREREREEGRRGERERREGEEGERERRDLSRAQTAILTHCCRNCFNSGVWSKSLPRKVSAI